MLSFVILLPHEGSTVVSSEVAQVSTKFPRPKKESYFAPVPSDSQSDALQSRWGRANPLSGCQPVSQSVSQAVGECVWGYAKGACNNLISLSLVIPSYSTSETISNNNKTNER